MYPHRILQPRLLPAVPISQKNVRLNTSNTIKDRSHPTTDEDCAKGIIVHWHATVDGEEGAETALRSLRSGL